MKSKNILKIAMLFLTLIIGISTASANMSWNVLAGGETSDMAMHGEGFYPGVITINAGDQINWTLGGQLVHTVTFLSGAPVPNPGDPVVFNPSGGSTYNGTGVVSSGLITPGTSYNLTFTEPGVYVYQCLIHPGMGGVVIVNSTGSPYPFNQTQYDEQGKIELEGDLNFGQELADNLGVTTSSGPNGTTVWDVASDIPLPTDASVNLSNNSNPGITGNATLNFIAPGSMEVKVRVSGLIPNSTHPEHIHAGTCGADGGIVFGLNNLTADANGNANSTTIINGPPWLAILSRGWFVNVHEGPALAGSGATPIACGDIVKHDAAYMRFIPENLTIQTGDQVRWTQLSPIEIHTVTFLAAGQPEPEFVLPNLTINPEAATRAGEDSHNGTGFYNSGILEPGQNYSLTFMKPGTYEYICVLHDDLGMKGNITVLPAGEKPGENVSIRRVTEIIDNMTGVPVINESTINIFSEDFMNFSSGDPYVITVTKVTDGTVEYNKSGTLMGLAKETIKVDWVPKTQGAYILRSQANTTADSRIVQVINQKVISPIPELSTIALVSAGLLGLFGLVRRRRNS